MVFSLRSFNASKSAICLHFASVTCNLLLFASLFCFPAYGQNVNEPIEGPLPITITVDERLFLLDYYNLPLQSNLFSNTLLFTFDRDGDGVPDIHDWDVDGDGIWNSLDGLTNPDRDGIPAFLDLDSDNDGISDGMEWGYPDHDGNGLIDYMMNDADLDGLPDDIWSHFFQFYVERAPLYADISPGYFRPHLNAAIRSSLEPRPPVLPLYLDTDEDGVIDEWLFDDENRNGYDDGLEWFDTFTNELPLVSSHRYTYSLHGWSFGDLDFYDHYELLQLLFGFGPIEDWRDEEEREDVLPALLQDVFGDNATPDHVNGERAMAQNARGRVALAFGGKGSFIRKKRSKERKPWRPFKRRPKATPTPTPTSAYPAPPPRHSDPRQNPEPGPSPDDCGEHPDRLKLTKGKSAGRLHNTYYYVANQGDYNSSGSAVFDIVNGADRRASTAFKRAAVIEGTARFSDGVVINYYSRGKWKITRHRYGVGNRNNPLRPYISVATGPRFRTGAWLCIPALRALKGGTHHGWFQVADVGGAIDNNDVDVFIGDPVFLPGSTTSTVDERDYRTGAGVQAYYGKSG